MKLAINYSQQAADLVSRDQLEIDYFKCSGQPEIVSQAQSLSPTVVHFNLDAGSGEVENADWETIQDLMDQTNTPFLNLHLAPYLDHYPDIPLDQPSPQQAEGVIHDLLEDIQAATRRFGPERVILENVPYRGAQGITVRSGVEPEVITRIIDQTGCGLLLDLSHARIAAHHLGMDEREYMQRLPCERLQELHFTGLHKLDGKLVDHLPVLEEDWPVLEWVIERIRSGEWAHAWLLTLEYGGVGEKYAHRSDPEVISAQVPRLRSIIERASQF